VDGKAGQHSTIFMHSVNSGNDPARIRAERRLGARLFGALRTVGNSDHGGADSGEVVFFSLSHKRRAFGRVGLGVEIMVYAAEFPFPAA
jgi:hypothetical protein